MYVWLHNKTTSTLAGAVLTISNVPNGNYQIRYFDSWLGTYTSPVSIAVTNGTMQINLPTFTSDGDFACEIAAGI
jgi:hypothetical protein